MLSLFKRLRRLRAPRVAQRYTDPGLAWLRADDEPPRPTLTNAFAESTWVYACVSAIAQQVAHTPFRLSQDDSPTPGRVGPRGDRILTSGPLVELFNQPHPHLDRFLFWELIVSWLLLRGRAFIIGLDAEDRVVPLNRALPPRLMVLNPDRLNRLIAGHQLLGYRYQAAHHDLVESQELLPEEVISVRLANPFDCCDGHSPAAVAALAAQTDFAAAQFMKGLMLSNGDTGLLVSVPHEPSPEQRAQILAALRDRRRKSGTPDRPLFLWNGATIEKPALSMVDIQFLENRKFSRQEICAIYKTPQEILGFTEDANRAVAQAARLNWIENTIAPLCERLAAAFSPLLRASRSISGWFDIESLPAVQQARRERFRVARQGFEMGVPLAVLNQLFDLGLPALPHGDTSFLPATFQAVNESAEKSLLPIEGPGGRRCEPSNGAPSLQDSNTPSLHSSSALRARLSRFFFEQRGRVLARFFAGAPSVFDLPAENECLRAALRPLLNEASASAHVLDINETTQQQLNDALNESGADSREGRADRIRRVFQCAARERAPMLAKLLTNHSPVISNQ
jgi:HK97 family phage portal protein